MSSSLVSSRLHGNLFAIASILIWSTTYPISDILLRSWNPLSLATFRVLGASLLVGVFALLFVSSRAYFRDWPIKQALVIGALGVGAGTVLMNLGFRYSNPVNIAIVSTMVPLVSVVMGVFRGEERFTARISIAILLAISGGVLVSFSSNNAETGFQGGEILMLMAVVLWTWFSRLSVTYLQVIPVFARTSITLLGGGLILAPLLILFDSMGVVEQTFSWSIEGSVLPIGLIFGVGFSTLFWFMSAERIGVTVAAIHINVVPFYVVLLMLIFFGGSILKGQVVGAILVVIGAILAQIPHRSKSR